MMKSGLTMGGAAISAAAWMAVSVAPTSLTAAPPRALNASGDSPTRALSGVNASSKLRGDLAAIMQQADRRELIPITVVMTSQADQDVLKFASTNPNKAERRDAVIDELKRVAEVGQADLLNAIDNWQAAGAVGERVKPLWLHSVIILKATPRVINAIAARPDVAWVNYDRPMGPEVFPIDPNIGDNAGGIGGGGNDDQSNGGGDGVLNGGGGQIECGVNLMGAPNVWNDFGITGEGVVVGVIDTGICLTHPDLANQIWENPNEIPNNGIDDDNNGYVDDTVGWNFESNNRIVNDSNGHGTHVSGTVGGDGTNGIQTGMAPNVDIMTLKFFNSLSGESSVWEAMQYGTDNGADVLTASLGWRHAWGPDRVTWRTLCDNTIAAGLIVIYAAGNEGTCCGPVDNVRTPGDVPDVITIGATDCNDNAASFSSRGPVTWQGILPWDDWHYPPGKMKPTVSAPGVDTISTRNNCTGYFSLSGTSMATPHVAGAVALILQANPNLDQFGVMDILEQTAIDLGSNGYDNTFGAGRVDAYEAVLLAIDSNTGTSVTDVQITMGSLISGGVNELATSDNLRLRAQSEFGFSAIEPEIMTMVVGFETGADNPSSMTLTIESAVNQPAGTATLRLKNFQSGQMETVETYGVDFGDDVHVVNGVGTANRIDGNGRIELEIKHVVVAGFSASGFRSSFDQVKIAVE